MAPASDEHPNTRFNAEVRKAYLDSLRSGNLKFESARIAGISYRTVERRRADDEDFRTEERLAMAEAREGIEKVLMNMAMDGDLGAIDRWLRAHDRSTYGDKKTVEVDATPAAVEASKATALARIAELQTELARRSAALDADDGVIDVPSRELPA